MSTPPKLTLADRIRAIARGELAVAPARDAATVILLRDNDFGGFEVYMLRRKAALKFAAGAYVFPGGSVDPADLDDPDQPADDVAVLRAAVREVQEETGAALGPATLVPWSRWVTPEVEPHRYDTRFFLAPIPSGQTPGPDGEGRYGDGEADADLWIAPADAVARHDAGDLPMLTPTAMTLREIAAFPDAAGLLEAARHRTIVPVRPRLTIDDNDVIGLSLA